MCKIYCLTCLMCLLSFLCGSSSSSVCACSLDLSLFISRRGRPHAPSTTGRGCWSAERSRATHGSRELACGVRPKKPYGVVILISYSTYMYIHVHTRISLQCPPYGLEINSDAVRTVHTGQKPLERSFLSSCFARRRASNQCIFNTKHPVYLSFLHPCSFPLESQ